MCSYHPSLLNQQANEGDVLVSGTSEDYTWITDCVNYKERRGLEDGCTCQRNPGSAYRSLLALALLFKIME